MNVYLFCYVYFFFSLPSTISPKHAMWPMILDWMHKTWNVTLLNIYKIRNIARKDERYGLLFPFGKVLKISCECKVEFWNGFELHKRVKTFTLILPTSGVWWSFFPIFMEALHSYLHLPSFWNKEYSSKVSTKRHADFQTYNFHKKIWNHPNVLSGFIIVRMIWKVILIGTAQMACPNV